MVSPVSTAASGRGPMADRADEAITLEVRELGQFQVLAEGEILNLGGPKQRAVLALLALAAPNGLSIDRLIEYVWGEGSPSAAASSVYSYISNLRALLGGSIERKGSLYILDAEFLSDARSFDRAVVDAHQELAISPDRTSKLLWDSLATWRGSPYADLDSVPGLQSEIRRLEDLRVQAQELRIDAELRCGYGIELIGELEALVSEHPYRERFRGQLMLALYRAGRQAESLRAYRAARNTLVEELGVDPSQELQDLERRILEQDASLKEASHWVTTQQAAFLFTDIEHSTAHWDLNPEAMAMALAIHDRLITEAVESSGGSLFKHTGDGTLAVFPKASQAARAAETAMRTLRATEWGQLGDLGVRMAIDAGAVDIRDGDYYGPPLNRCARILAAGHSGQVLLSSSAFEELSVSHPPGMQIRLLGPHTLRGLVEPERIAQLVFVGLPAEFPKLRTDTDPLAFDPRIAVGGLPGYEVRERLGASEWGTVYRAYQPAVGREVAIRIIGPAQANHPQFIRRFEAEAQRLAALTHPHIVPIHDFWRDHNGAYLVTQLLAGGSLRQSMRGDRWDPAIMVPILRHVGSALAYLHGEGETHGDLRPENVLLDGAGNTYLTDLGFGLHTLLPGEARTRRRTPYRAPDAELTPASDIYSFGMLAYELLTAHDVAHDGSPVDVTKFGFDQGVEDVLARATARNPEDRFEDVVVFLDALESALGIGDGVDTPRVRTPLRNPFKGLRAFTENDASDFHGRDELIRSMLDAAGHHALVAVVGPSGSGKSSALHAGFIPQLRDGALEGSDDWLIVSMTPNADPILSLANALRGIASASLGDVVGRLESERTKLGDLVEELLPEGAGTCLLVVDQLEELFSVCESESTRERFLNLVGEGAVEEGRLRVVLVLRADFYDRPLAYQSVAGKIARGLITVVPPTLRELTQAIERPAAAAGLAFEPGLPRRIAGDVLGQPGGLPLLQHALAELVERRGADLISGIDYEAIGTVTGAVARRAETAFADLEPDDRPVARRILMRLVSVTEDADDTRRRARLGELQTATDAPAAVDRVLTTFGSARLLQFDRDPITRGPSVEVAHEALLREWFRLAGWIDEERERLVLARRLRSAREEWEDSGRVDDFLLGGERLAPMRVWASPELLSREELEFLDRSLEADEAARRALRWRRRVAFSAVSVAAVVAAVLAVLAMFQWQRADDEAARAAALAGKESVARAEADGQRRVAEAESVRAEQEAVKAQEAAVSADNAATLARAYELAASANVVGEEDPQLALLLALEAVDLLSYEVTLPLEFSGALRRALHSDRLVRVLHLEGPSDARNQTWVDVRSVGGGSLLLATSSRTHVFSAETWEELPVVFEGQEASRIEAMSPDGRTGLVSVFRDESTAEVRVVDLTSGEVLRVLGDGCWTGPSDWAPEGDLVAVILWCGDDDPGSAYLYDTVSWAVVAHYEMEYPISVQFAGNEGVHRLLVVDYYQQPGTRMIDTETLEVAATFDSGSSALSPDGSTLLTYGMLATDVALIDVESGSVIDRLSGAQGLVNPGSASFSPDGGLVTLTTEGAFVPVWNVETGELVVEIPAGKGSSTAFGWAGDTLVTGSVDGSVSIWDLSAAATGELNSADIGWVNSNSAQAGPAIGVVWTYDFALGQAFPYTFDVETGTALQRLTEPSAFWPAVSTDGIVYLAGGNTAWGPVRLWDPATGGITDLSGCWRDDQTEPCPDGTIPAPFSGLTSSVDGSEAGLLRADGSFEAWGASGGELEPVLLDLREDEGFLMAFDGEWVLVRTTTFGDFAVFERATGERITSFGLEGHMWIRFDREGRIGVGWGFDSRLSVLSPENWTSELLTPDLGDGTPRGVALSPNGDKVAVGAQDGFVRIFDMQSATLLDEISIGEVAAAHWIDDDHLAVGTRDGLWTVLLLDPADLVDAARLSVMRGFTPNECALYRIESCTP